MRQAEERLDLIWQKFDSFASFLPENKTLLEALRRRAHDFRRTSPWIDSNDAASPTPCSVEDQRGLNFELQFRTESTLTKASNGRKHSVDASSRKRKDSPEKATNRHPVDTTTLRTPDALPKSSQLFEVDTRSFRVFQTIFFVPSEGKKPGEIPWKDFLHAMCKMGFGAEKIKGSVWLFEPSTAEGSVQRKINFHEPHPDHKIPYVLARRLGCRLERVYGWRGDMFVLAKK